MCAVDRDSRQPVRRTSSVYEAVRNAWTVGGLFSGALITETVFAWPGMGRLIYDSVMGNDFNLALIGLLLTTATTLAGSVLADLATWWLDPRVTRP